MKWDITLTIPALKQLAAIKDIRKRESISRRINALESNPEEQGKPLADELAGYRSIRAIGQRYNILYKVGTNTVTIYLIQSGIPKGDDKKDVQTLVKKLARLGLLDQVE